MSGGLFQILDKIKAKPGMYIGKTSVSELFTFLIGYKTARRELDIELTEPEADFYNNFHNFVEKRYKLHRSNSWAKIIMLYCHDEKDGLEDFFNLLDEFKQRDKSLDEDWFDEIVDTSKNIVKEAIKSAY